METREFMFCSNCGEKILKGSKFCNSCGSKIITIDDNGYNASKMRQQSTYDQRKNEYAGTIIKCPSCGNELASFTAVCPSCGHEVNRSKVSDTLCKFIETIDECDRLIREDNTVPSKSKGLLSKRGIISMIKPLYMPNFVPNLSVNEKRKVDIIQNYAFPNERETIIEALMFIKSKIAFLSSQDLDEKTIYWINLWHIKAEQLKSRSSIVLQGDSVVASVCADISNMKSSIEKKIKKRTFLVLAIIIVWLGLNVFVPRILSLTGSL